MLCWAASKRCIPFLCNYLENFPQTGQFLSLRATTARDDVAGCCLEREVIMEIALRRLHAHIQDPLPTGSHSVSLVVNPTWKPGKSFQNSGEPCSAQI